MQYVLMLSVLMLAAAFQAAAAVDTSQYSMELMWEFQPDSDGITCADISPDTTKIAAAGGSYVYMLGRDGGIIWEKNTDERINDIATAIDGRYTVFVTQNGYVYRFNNEGTRVFMKAISGSTLIATAITEDGKNEFAGADFFPVYMLDADGNLVWKQGFSGVLKGMAASDSGDVVAAINGDGSLFAYYKTGSPRWSKSHNYKTTCVDVSANGAVIAVGLDNGDVIRYDADSGEEIFRDTLPFVPSSVSLSERGADMAVSGENSATVYYYSVDFRNFEPITVKTGSFVKSVKLSKSANNMAVVSTAGKLSYYYRYSPNFVQPTASVTPVPKVSVEANVLEIESEPKGAQVLIDNKIVGITPLTLTDVAEGQHTLLIRLQGYQDWERQFSLGGGSNVKIAAELIPLQQDEFPWIPVIIGIIAVIAVVAYIIWRRNRVDYNYLF